MNYAELLGFSPAFGMDKPIEPDMGANDKREPTPVSEADTNKLTFTNDQLKTLALLGQAGQQNPMRAPQVAPIQRPQMLPMTQLQLPQTGQAAPRPGLAQLIYGR